MLLRSYEAVDSSSESSDTKSTSLFPICVLVIWKRSVHQESVLRHWPKLPGEDWAPTLTLEDKTWFEIVPHVYGRASFVATCPGHVSHPAMCHHEQCWSDQTLAVDSLNTWRCVQCHPPRHCKWWQLLLSLPLSAKHSILSLLQIMFTCTYNIFGTNLTRRYSWLWWSWRWPHWPVWQGTHGSCWWGSKRGNYPENIGLITCNVGNSGDGG